MKNILVTGISRGMGMATARLLVQEGYFVHGAYHTNKDDAEKLKNELTNIEIYQYDFRDRKQTKKLISELKDIRFDGIVNSAGIFLDTEVDILDEKNWDDVFEVNLTTPMLICSGLYGSLNKDASVVNIASVDGMTGSISGIAYSASKAAMINMTQSLANGMAEKKVRVNSLSPGWIDDGMQAPQGVLDAAADYNTLKRVGTYEEIAQLVSFLLSEKSSFITGSNFVIDGGETSTSYLYKVESELL